MKAGPASSPFSKNTAIRCRFAAFEIECGERCAAASLFTLPSPLADPRYADHWWSLGVRQADGHPELLLLSGPIGYNGRAGACKALQKGSLQLPGQYLAVRPGTVIEKEFRLAIDPAPLRGQLSGGLSIGRWSCMRLFRARGCRASRRSWRRNAS